MTTCYDGGEMVSQNKGKAKGKAPAHAWKPGQSGNPGGRPKDGLSLASLLRVELEKDGGGGKTKGELIAEKWVELGLAGSPVAISAMADRIDGKAAQSLTLTGDSAEPLHVRHSERLPVPSPNGSPTPTPTD